MRKKTAEEKAWERAEIERIEQVQQEIENANRGKTETERLAEAIFGPEVK